jgi:ADP-dependent NAD(P)H-hydrate dehydratase / NAD(P)H-hydrate epimerase
MRPLGNVEAVSIIAAMKALEERLPRAVYTAAQVRELDRLAIEEHGVPSYELMQRAAAAALAALRSHWPAARHVLVVCGAGNNAGDGYVLARLATSAGLSTRVLALVAEDQLKGDAALAARDCRAAGVPVDSFDPAAGLGAPTADLVVDALLGTGLDRPLEGDFAAAVEGLNAYRRPILALDVPSGLHADTGLPLGVAVRADVTVTFVGLKQGLFLGAASDYCGQLEFADLGLPAGLRSGLRAPLERLTAEDLHRALPRRPRSQHKGSSGRLVLIGGAPGMAGAIRLAAEAALRTGAGLVYVATHPASMPIVMAGRPEIMCRPIDTLSDLEPLLAGADAIVAGPGLGRTQWAASLWQRALASPLPLVADADALNLLADAPAARNDWILTPHPGEASRLLGISVAEVQRDRRLAVRTLAERYHALAVLKGAGSLVASPGGESPVSVCDHGNPGMATGGMGDVLSGVLGALLAQTRDPAVSARAGVLLHALAGDAAAANGERGLIASDLMPYLQQWANPS